MSLQEPTFPGLESTSQDAGARDNRPPGGPPGPDGSPRMVAFGPPAEVVRGRRFQLCPGRLPAGLGPPRPPALHQARDRAPRGARDDRPGRAGPRPGRHAAGQCRGRPGDGRPDRLRGRGRSRTGRLPRARASRRARERGPAALRDPRARPGCAAGGRPESAGGRREPRAPLPGSRDAVRDPDEPAGRSPTAWTPRGSASASMSATPTSSRSSAGPHSSASSSRCWTR